VDTRETVLQYATQLSAGDRLPTARELSTASGVSVGSIYHHFGSLDGVLEHVRQRFFATWVEGFIEALGSSGDAAAGLDAAYRFHRSWLLAHPGRFNQTVAIANSGALGPAAGRFADGLGAWFAKHGVAQAHQRIAGALLLGPLIELSRQNEHLKKPLAEAPLRALAAAVAAGIQALAARPGAPTPTTRTVRRGT
jgi:AcrR family transcriptional regulator